VNPNPRFPDSNIGSLKFLGKQKEIRLRPQDPRDRDQERP